MKIFLNNRFVILIIIFLSLYIISIDDSGEACSFSSMCGELGDSFYINWPSENSGGVNRNQSIELKISGKCPNFTWTVDGKGFWLDADHTTTQLETANETVTLYADGSSCGSAEITITDTCNQTFTTYIKSNVGYWKSCPEPDTGIVKLSNWPTKQRLTWSVGKFQFYNWLTRCCENLGDYSKSGCEWAQCPGEGMGKTTICAEDYGSSSCEFGICWCAYGDRDPGHMRYWACQQ